MKTTAEDLMSLEFTTISAEAPVMEAVERIAQSRTRESGYKTISLMVLDPMDRLAGVISMMDILYHVRPPFYNYLEDNSGMELDEYSPYLERFKGLQIKHVMSTQVSAATPDENILVLVDRMVKRKIRRLPVLEDGKVIGVVYLAELFQHLCHNWLGVGDSK